MAQIRELQNKVNSLSDAREFYDLESGSSSGATHVLDHAFTILSSRTLPRCDSGLPRNTQNCTSIMGDVFERPLAQEGLSSTIVNNSKNLASSSQRLRLDTTDTSRQSDGMKRESLNTLTQAPHFQSRSGIYPTQRGIYSQSGMCSVSKIFHCRIESWKIS